MHSDTHQNYLTLPLYFKLLIFARDQIFTRLAKSPLLICTVHNKGDLRRAQPHVVHVQAGDISDIKVKNNYESS